MESRDAFWGQVQALGVMGVSVTKMALLLRCSRHKIYEYLRLKAPPGVARSARNASSPKTLSLACRRRRVHQLALKKVTVTAKKTVYQRGRPRKDGAPRPTYEVTRKFTKSSFPSPQSIARQLGVEGIRVSASTVRRDLLEAGLKCYKRPVVPALTADQAQARLAFAKKMLKWPKDSLYKILFTDEKWFDSNDSGVVYQWVKRGARRDLLPRERVQCPPKVFIWGAIGIGWRLIVVIEGESVTGETYKEQCLRRLRREPLSGRLLMQDGAKVHWTPENRRYIKNNLRLQVVDGWPAQSPDLNPIEHMWSRVQQRVSERGPWGREDLAKYVVEEWNAVPVEVVDGLVMSFGKRLSECVDRSGYQLWQ